jgi:ribonuclease J
MGAETPTAAPVKLTALGGLGEIGLNLTTLECAGSAIVIDAGLMFPEDRLLANGVYIPDFSALIESKASIAAVVLTHAHEDHIGALPHLLRHFNVPVYATSVTLAFARRRLAEANLGFDPDLRTIAPRKPFAAGPFTIEPLGVTHSTPDSVALAIRTAQGVIVHTGDFKIDREPVDGDRFDTEGFAALGREGVTLLLSDSTNVEREGRSASESSLRPVLRELVARAGGRFFLTAFSSHLCRIRQATEVSREFGRRVIPLGRRMAESTRLGMETGRLSFPLGTFAEIQEAESAEPRKLTFLVSGSQGEPFSALARLAADMHPNVQVEPGDTVVLSSRFIPGNERAINAVLNQLCRLGAEVFYEGIAPVHASGHAARDELAEMIRLTRPRYFVPIHGEFRHLRSHVLLAAEAGVAERNCFLMENGDSLVLAEGQARRGHAVRAGRMLIEGGEVEDLSILGERRVLAREGALVVVIAVSARSGRIVSGPDLFSRGLVSGDGTSAHIRRAREELIERLEAIEAPYYCNDPRIAGEVVRAMRRYFADAVGKRPLVIPHVMEVP